MKEMNNPKTFKVQWMGNEDKPSVTIEIEESIWTEEKAFKLVSDFHLAKSYLKSTEKNNSIDAVLKLIACEMIYQTMVGNEVNYNLFRHLKKNGYPMMNGESGIRVLDVDRILIRPESLVITEIKEG
ncbi:DUF2528 family protein [Salmonella enterica]|nr:DUF2528 family protein [Salmonella enterica subsp. enterica serovar Kokomlemle]EGQ5166037.1 DUF2528 family protein [Salmonella enterica]EHN1693786.1 DUF2528 family protein [Salmonella enterica subsp. enterica serovar Newport]EKA4656571.1 DUF2528 family protein [Salmonella enterica]EKF8523852.1 DUF2528 family protein [Salmonella enterica]